MFLDEDRFAAPFSYSQAQNHHSELQAVVAGGGVDLSIWTAQKAIPRHFEPS